ncbi:MAG: DsbA family oxidoreductase [Leptothrix sp. (in: b-proteobacteria)]
MLKIDIVSDVVCPWCAVGVSSLLQALEELGDLPVALHFQPFELNPTLPPGGADLVEYLGRKYGVSAGQVAQMHEQIRQRGEAVGFTFDIAKRTRTYNTFDAHRLLHWAGEQDQVSGAGHPRDHQLRLKQALLRAHFTDGQDPGDAEVLVRLATEAGLDAEAARTVLARGDHADAVREREAHYRAQGIQSVPSFIVNDQHLIEGGQPPQVFVQALRQIAAQA